MRVCVCLSARLARLAARVLSPGDADAISSDDELFTEPEVFYRLYIMSVAEAIIEYD